jgi:RNA polymerase sigma factor (TIGR02999 family)
MCEPLKITAASPTSAVPLDQLVPLVYKDLCALAERLMKGERRDHTLAATALVHEAYLRLVQQPTGKWDHRGHFFAAAARTMRCILIDHAKRRGRKKRLGGRRRIQLDADYLKVSESDEGLVALDEVLTKMAAVDADLARIVELRFFVGLTIEQTAEVLGISTSSVERSWRAAKVWLSAKLESETNTQ